MGIFECVIERLSLKIKHVLSVILLIKWTYFCLILQREVNIDELNIVSYMTNLILAY